MLVVVASKNFRKGLEKKERKSVIIGPTKLRHWKLPSKLTQTIPRQKVHVSNIKRFKVTCIITTEIRRLSDMDAIMDHPTLIFLSTTNSPKVTCGPLP